MNAEIKQMHEEKQAAELQAFKDEFSAKLDAIAEAQVAATSAPKESPIDETVKQVTEATESINKFRTMLGLPPLDAKPPETEKKMTREEAAKLLEAEGWEVKGPMTPAQMAKHFDEALAKVKEETKEETKEEMKRKFKSDEKRNGMLFDLASTFLESALPIIGNTGAKKGLDVAAKALQAAKGLTTE